MYALLVFYIIVLPFEATRCPWEKLAAHWYVCVCVCVHVFSTDVTARLSARLAVYPAISGEV
jgi:hypothetical protein